MRYLFLEVFFEIRFVPEQLGSQRGLHALHRRLQQENARIPASHIEYKYQRAPLLPITVYLGGGTATMVHVTKNAVRIGRQLVCLFYTAFDDI